MNPKKEKEYKITCNVATKKVSNSKSRYKHVRDIKNQILPSHLPKFCSGYKLLINVADDDRRYSIDMSCTDKEYSIDNLKSTNKKNIDDGYKEENLQHQHCNASVINKTKEEEVLIKKLMSVNFQKKVIHYVICTVTSCSKKERIGKKIKKETKYIWETLHVIPLLPLIGANHRQPLLYTSKRMVHLYSTNERTNQFSIGYIINP